MGILETICGERREEVARVSRKRPASSFVREAGTPRAAFPPRRAEEGFPRGRPFLIAECKKASPSRGLMVADYDPLALARAYEAGGASVVSVLTEPRHFLGEGAHLAAVRRAVRLPVLRKDFIVDPWQLRESWALGADAVLLIAACLDASLLAELAEGARELGLSTLIETRTEKEVEAALAARPDAIGVNARDLRDFSVSLDHASKILGPLSSLAPRELPRIAESGIRRPEDALALWDAGFDGFLVGEALATAKDPGEATRAMLRHLLGPRSAPLPETLR